MTITIEGIEIELHHSVKTLPILRYKRLFGLLMEDSGLGGSIADVFTRLQTISNYAEIKKQQEVFDEATNLTFTLWHTLNNESYKVQALACLITSINGESFADYEGESLTKMVGKVNRISEGEIRKLLTKIKGGIDEQLQMYFPAIFSTDIQHIENLRDYFYWNAKLLQGEEERTAKAKIEELNDYFQRVGTPQVFNPRDERSIVIGADKEFERTINIMEENQMHNVKQLTTFEYYSKVEYLTQKTKSLKDSANSVSG